MTRTSTDTGRQLLRLAKARRYAASGEAREVRSSAGISMSEMADALGVNESTVCRWETGVRRPRGSAAVQWIDMLDELRRDKRGAA